MGAEKIFTITHAAEISQKKTVDFEDLLEIVGSYGKYQKRLVYFFLVPIAITLPFLCMNLIFMLSTPTHGCRQPHINAMINLTESEKMDLVRPWKTDHTSNVVQSSCDMYDLNYTSVFEDMAELSMNVSDYVKKYSATWKMESCKYGWEYDQSLYRRTVTTEWDLVCERNYLPSLVYTLSNVGSAVGTPIFGSLSDKIGRKISFFATCLIGAVSGVLTVTIPTFIAFIVVKAINGSLLPSVFQLPYLILVEIVSPEMRTRMNGVACIGWTIGLALMPLIGWLTADWVYFGWVCAVVSFPYLVCYWILPESPRWLMSQNRFEDASKVLEKVARVNGKDISNLDLVSLFKKVSSRENEANKSSSVSPLELFKNPTIRRRFIFISASWIADAMTYYGFHINISSLYGNEFLNFFLLALVELPSYMFTWFLVETKLGRRWSNVLFLYLTALACILPITAPAGATTFITVASLVGKFGVSASYMVMYQQAAEIFPTPLRASGMGIAGTLASIVAICTPYIVYLSEYGRHIPFTFMSCISFAAGTCALFIPETLNENLPQTVADGENFGKDKPFFSFANTKKKLDSMKLKKKQSVDSTMVNPVA